MRERKNERGFSALEMLVATTVLLAAMGGLAGVLIQNSRMSKQQQMQARVQADARNTLSLIVQQTRSAGWNPIGTIDFDAATVDNSGTNSTSEMTIRADLNDDGDIDDEGEQLLIRHRDNLIEWRTSPSGDFETVATNVDNDSDGDGIIEPMFVADADPPTRITITVTARSEQKTLLKQEYLRYTVTSDVVLRSELE